MFQKELVEKPNKKHEKIEYIKDSESENEIAQTILIVKQKNLRRRTNTGEK